MQCRRCGTQLAQDAVCCHSCGEPVQPQNAQGPGAYESGNPQEPYNGQGYQQPMYTQPPMSNTAYLVWSIIVTLFCLPFGIPAIIYAVKMDSALSRGDINGARDCAKKSKLFSILGGVIFAVGIVLYIILVIVIFGIIAYETPVFY